MVSTATCSIAEGAGRLYGVNVLTGAAFPWTDVNDGNITDKTSRYMDLGAGIASEAVPIFTAKGVRIIVGTGGGVVNADPGIPEIQRRNYWTRG